MLTPYEFDAERFSRWMAYVLRHNPERYGLQPDRHGFVDLDAFLLIARRRYPQASEETLRKLIESVGAARFEVSGGRLRARYGHSIAVEPAGPPVTPPEQLYCGVEAAQVESILRDGLMPVDRQLLHLSTSREEAASLIRRKTGQPALLAIDAARAHAAGVAFHLESKVYLAAQIAPQFLRQESLPAESAGAASGSGA